MTPREARIGRTVAESTPWWPAPVTAPKGSPNVLLVVFDDVGFSDLGCYGSGIRTPHADALAGRGLRYTNFHTAAVCSSSRASLLTGRNHHAVGMGNVANWDTGFPGYRGRIAKSAGMLSEILQGHGYSTWCVGKWHVTPLDETSAAGPYDQWPTRRGFDRFHGVFVGGSEWAPNGLVDDNHYVDTPRRPGYHFSEDIVDHALQFARDHVSVYPERPFFGYVCFHACHAPLHAPAALIDSYREMFAHGWDAERQQRFERQLDLGVVPAGTLLPPRNPTVRPWDDLGAVEQETCLRLQQAYAGMLEHADAQLGRLLEGLDAYGVIDRTLVVLLSDNGGTYEGGDLGSPFMHRRLNRLPAIDPSETLARLDEIGGPHSYPVYPSGWGAVSNTPLRWYKTMTHGGGIRDPLVIALPGNQGDRGELRTQYHHISDIAPTVLELVGIDPPETLGGVPQQPVTGTSLAYTFDEAGAPTRKETQYYEMFGHRGLWHRGWKAVTHHERGADFDADTWELYHLDEDFSECTDLAADRPDKVSELVDLWWVEAGKYQVLPLDDRLGERYRVPKPRPLRDRGRFVYFPGITVPIEGAVDVRDASYRVTAVVRRFEPSQSGVLVACGDRTLGYSLYVLDGRLVHDYNAAGRHFTVRSAPLPAGVERLAFEMRPLGEDQGLGTLYVDTAAAGEMVVGELLRYSFGSVTLTVGRNGGTSVHPEYEAPFPYSGTLVRVEFEPADVTPVPVSPAGPSAPGAAVTAGGSAPPG